MMHKAHHYVLREGGGDEVEEKQAITVRSRNMPMRWGRVWAGRFAG